MIDTPYGLGALPEDPDPRDWPVSALYAAEDIEPTVALPASYATPIMPAVLDQGQTPMCVAFSSSALKAWHDKRDQSAWFDFDEPRFFHEIGGTSYGAFVHRALDQLLLHGYPVSATGDPGHHRIEAYFSVPLMPAAIKAAIMDFGPLLISTPWFASWFRPTKDGVLPAPDREIGGHAIVAAGWDQRGIRLRNSWGDSWGIDGDCWMPEANIAALNGAWRTVDQVVHPIPWRHTVDALALLNVRAEPRATARRTGSVGKGRDVSTLQLEKFGGRYLDAAGRSRTDWLLVRDGWIARGWTRQVR